MAGVPAAAVYVGRRWWRGRLVPRPHIVRRRAKKHRSYDVSEVARLYGVHRNMVRNWIKAGLPVIGEGRSLLILGEELERFLKARRASKRRPCAPGMIYCLKCREPRMPVPGSLDRSTVTARTALVIGVCSNCGTGLNRRTRLADLAQWTRPSCTPETENGTPVSADEAGA